MNLTPSLTFAALWKSDHATIFGGEFRFSNNATHFYSITVFNRRFSRRWKIIDITRQYPDQTAPLRNASGITLSILLIFWNDIGKINFARQVGGHVLCLFFRGFARSSRKRDFSQDLSFLDLLTISNHDGRTLREGKSLIPVWAIYGNFIINIC